MLSYCKTSALPLRKATFNNGTLGDRRGVSVDVYNDDEDSRGISKVERYDQYGPRQLWNF